MDFQNLDRHLPIPEQMKEDLQVHFQLVRGVLLTYSYRGLTIIAGEMKTHFRHLNTQMRANACKLK